MALDAIINCGTCEFCKGGQENLCTAKKFPGSATTVPHIDGFFQAAFDFPAKCCYPAPEGTNPGHLTFAEPLACAMHSVTVSKAGKGSKVLITGCGQVGLLALVAVKAVGAEVHVSDVRAEAVPLAVKVGAAKGYVTGQDEVPALAFDAVIEASARPTPLIRRWKRSNGRGGFRSCPTSNQPPRRSICTASC